MGTTLGLMTFTDGTMSEDGDDYEVIGEVLDELDEVCDAQGVTKLSEFVDMHSGPQDTDDEDDSYERNDEEDPYDMTDEDGELPQSGASDMTWFDPEDGLESFRAVLDNVHTVPSVADDPAQLQDEIESCVHALEATSERGGTFHLALLG